MSREFKICPSILAQDFMEMGSAIDELIAAGCQHLHMDVMDGHFVPAITFGQKMIADARARFPGMVDCHLMVDDPRGQMDQMIAAGVDLIIFHYEVVIDIPGMIERVHAAGKLAGLAIDGPTADFSDIDTYLDQLDVVLIATGKVGKAGQALDPGCLDKVRALRAMDGGGAVDVMVDIGINADTIEAAKAAGANWFVVSSGIFKSPEGIGPAFTQLNHMIQSN